MIVVSIAAMVAEHIMIDRDLLAAAVIVAAVATILGVITARAAVRGIREHLRAGGTLA